MYDLMFAFALAFIALEHKGLFLRKLGLGCYVISKCLGNICKLHKCQILSSSLNCITTKTIHLNDHNAFKKNRILCSNYFLDSRCCKGYMYRKIRKYAINGKKEKDLRDDAKKELGRIFRSEFHMNAFQVRQGKGTSNSGEHMILLPTIVKNLALVAHS